MAELAEANGRLAEANAQLAERESFTAALLETIEVGIVFCDAEGGSMIRNRAERRMVGLDDSLHRFQPEQIPSLVDVLDAAGSPVPVSDQPLMRTLRGEDIGELDLFLGPRGGPHREVVIRGSRITDAAGVVAGAVVSITDVTAERTTSRALIEEHRKLNEAQRLGQIGSFSFDPIERAFTFSDQLLEIWGASSQAELVLAGDAWIHPQDRDVAADSWGRALREGGRIQHEFRIQRPDRRLRYLRADLNVTLDEHGNAVRLVGTNLDVTDLTSARLSTQEANAFFQSVLTVSPDYTFITDVATDAVIYGTPGLAVLGIDGELIEALGSEVIAALVHPDDQQKLRTANDSASELADGQVLQLRYRARHAGGHWVWLNRRVTPFRRDDAGVLLEVLGVIRDVTDVVLAEEKLTHAALHDHLTGLPNRALLIDRLDTALTHSERNRREIAVLFCDLDGFKKVNDTAGHAAGDAVLLETARRLALVLRGKDTVARVGGDEFVIILEPWNRGTSGGRRAEQPDVAADRMLATRVADRISNALRQPITVDGVEHTVSVSIGITHAGLPAPGEMRVLSAAQVLADADTAMYLAKTGGKDRFEIFAGQPTDPGDAGRVERILRRALAGEAAAGTRSELRPGAALLSLEYQAIHDSASGKLLGFEALAHLSDDDGFDIPPEVFLPIAAVTGMMTQLVRRVLDQACHRLAEWRAHRPDLLDATMAVNVSELQAQEPRFVDDVLGLIASHRLATRDVVLEFTETALLDATAAVMQRLTRLRSAGVGIAIDDFGSAYTSTDRLAAMPVSAVKVDRAITAGLPHSAVSRRMVDAIALHAASLGLDCTVDGVDTEDQRGALPGGIRLQGSLLGQPLRHPPGDWTVPAPRAGQGIADTIRSFSA